jgi:DNA-directed RNA polymerase subunit L
MRFSDLRIDKFGALEFRAEGRLSVTHALCRVVQAEVPTVALDYDPERASNPDVHVMVNTGALHNELLVQRLSLVPIHATPDEVAGWDPDALRFVLRAKNTGALSVAVTSADIGVLDSTGQPVPRSMRDRLFPPDPITGDHVLITRLHPGHVGGGGDGDEVHVDFRATVGTQMDRHARHSPVSACFHVYEVDEEHAARELEAVRARAREEGEDEDHAASDFAALDRQRCYRRDEHGEPASFVVRLEPRCGQDARALVAQGFRILRSKCTALSADERPMALVPEKAGGGESSEAGSPDIPMHLFTLQLEGQDDTLGNVLSDELQRSGELLFAGYHRPHPLCREIVFRLGSRAQDGVERVEHELRRALTSLADLFGRAEEWWRLEATGTGVSMGSDKSPRRLHGRSPRPGDPAAAPPEPVA